MEGVITMVQENLAAYIKRMGIKQKHIADKTGMTEMSVSSSLRCERRLSADEFYLICEAIDKPMDYFRNRDSSEACKSS